ncbi:MAG: ATP-dependent 6-phosphofructokinase [Candidatus Sumerlaeia bacterium]|nr:ATP-dependent 6-phosphofructokinase [Candidatus Sumerlaeia bacterium]
MPSKPLHLGILTGGGDCPGLNPVIRGVVYQAETLGHRVTGFLRGWAGLLPPGHRDSSVKVPSGETRPLTRADVELIHSEGGSILFSSRTNLKKVKDGYAAAKEMLGRHGIDVLLATGGDDTLSVAQELHQEGVKIIGIPKTIDNDLPGTDQTFGFDTAANIAMEALDRLHSTAKSHERCLVVEIMGRHAGWITYAAGVAAGAHLVLVPEVKYDLDEIYRVVRARRDGGKHHTLIACSEGAVPLDSQIDEVVDPKAPKKYDAFGNVQLGGIGKTLAKLIEKHTGVETRDVVLGHLQRGGAPTCFDRVFGMRLGIAAANLADQGISGKLVALKGTEIVALDITDALGATQETRKTKRLPVAWYDAVRPFMG